MKWRLHYLIKVVTDQLRQTASIISGMLIEEVEGEGRRFGVDGVDVCFNDECHGSDGGHTDDVGVGFVKRREIEAVAVDVLAVANDGGKMRMKLGRCRDRWRGSFV